MEGCAHRILRDCLSKKDAIALLELIHSSVLCSNEQNFRMLMKRLHSLIPHDYAVCALAQTDDKGTLRSYDAINISYPSEWIELYIRNNEHERDPIFKANFSRFRLQYFDDVLKEYSYPADAHKVANDFGIIDGYVHGIRNRSKGSSLFCFAGRRIDRDKMTEVILELIIPHLHQALTRVLNSHNDKKFSLSQRELEILKWIKQGKSTWEISAILSISKNTVKFHVKNIMQKLNASNRLHAVAIAMEQGVVDIE